MVNCDTWMQPNEHAATELGSAVNPSQSSSRGRKKASSNRRSTSPSAPAGEQITTLGSEIQSQPNVGGPEPCESILLEPANVARPCVQSVTIETETPPTISPATLFSSAESVTCAKMADSPKSQIVLPAGLKPYYSHAGIVILHGDCREVLPQLQQCDAVITDPPFGIAWGRATWHDGVDEYPELMRWLVSECNRLVVNGWCFVFQAMLNAPRFHEWFGSSWRIYAACKNFAQIRPTGIWHSWDPVVFWSNGKPCRNTDAAEVVNRDYFLGNMAGVFGEKSEHPCPRPIDTMEHITCIASLPNALVIDPFCGSGTTLKAAKDLSRSAIGIEIEEKYCEIAAKRLSQEVFQFT